MNNLLPLFIEVVVLFGIYCLASALTWSTLRRYKEGNAKTAGLFSCLGHLFAFISRRWLSWSLLRRRPGSLKNAFSVDTAAPSAPCRLALFLGGCSGDRVY